MSEQQSPQQSSYETFAQTVGGVPSLNGRDNLYQGVFVLVCTLLMAALGLVMGGGQVALVMALLGIIGSGLLSGFVLMILGFVRAAKKAK